MSAPGSMPRAPVQPGFLIDREKELEGAVDERSVFHNGQSGGDADAVVRAERRSSGVDPAVLDFGFDRVLGEIMADVGVFLADHVQMALENDRFRVFPAGREPASGR